jgi:hypothetical protein
MGGSVLQRFQVAVPRSHSAIAFSELIYSEASLLSRRDHQGAPTFE